MVSFTGRSSGSRTGCDARVAAVRRFNRFYTQQVGILPRSYLGSSLSLAEVRVLFELANRDGTTAVELARELELDAGYLSRILQGFHHRSWIARTRSESDSRQRLVQLTPKGRHAFEPLDRLARQQISNLLNRLPEEGQRRLVDSMATIEALLGPARVETAAYVLRPPRAGDMGWVVQLHGALYAQEYGWDQQFEALVAEIVARFVHNQDPRWDRCWIAERDGQNVGCVFCVRKSATVAQLRLLLVDPKARGMAMGTGLVAECVQFAQSAGYRKIMLWTNDGLHAARRIYEGAGFRLVREEKHRSFGHDLVGQFWELSLRRTSDRRAVGPRYDGRRTGNHRGG